MSEDENMPMETTAEDGSETTAAPVNPEAPTTPSLGVNDLKVMANIIEVVSNRGAIRANEMAAVGNVYNILMNFLIANGAVKPAEKQEETTEAPVENPALAEKQEEVAND